MNNSDNKSLFKKEILKKIHQKNKKIIFLRFNIKILKNPKFKSHSIKKAKYQHSQLKKILFNV